MMNDHKPYNDPLHETRTTINTKIAHVADAESLMTAQIETNRKLSQFMEQKEAKDTNSKKRKHEDSDDDGLLFRARKRRKKSKATVRFNISSDYNQRFNAMNSKKGSPRSGKASSGKNEDDDLELLAPDGVEEEYDDDAIGDDLFDLMPDMDDDDMADGAGDAHFGAVIETAQPPPVATADTTNNAVDGTAQSTESKPIGDGSGLNQGDGESNNQNTNVPVAVPRERVQLPMMKCAVNNSSIWPNTNKEFASGDWLKSVIVSEATPPAVAMNTNLIIDLNDPRMGWNEDFIKKMTRIGETMRDSALNDQSQLQSNQQKMTLEQRFSVKKFNLSNDDKYTFADISVAQKRNLHTPMAYNLHKDIFPNKTDPEAWVALHRQRLKLDAISVGQKEIKICIASKSAKRSKALHKYSMYVPKNWRELSATEDRLVLLEYLEQYPLIIQSTGMASNITTLYRQSVEEFEEEAVPPEIEVDDGTVRFLGPKEESPLLGAPMQTKYVTIIHNKLYVAPIRSHNAALNVDNYTNYDVPKSSENEQTDSNSNDSKGTDDGTECKSNAENDKNVNSTKSNGKEEASEDGDENDGNDPKPRGNRYFLLVGSGHTYYIRKFDHIWAVGQVQPKQVVYHPGSRALRSFMHDRCKVNIYRTLLQNETVVIANLTRDYPLVTTDAAKETLRMVAVHTEGGLWARKEDFVQNYSEIEIQQMVAPEQEVLRMMFYNCYCRLLQAGVSNMLIAGNKGGGGWKRVLKNLVFNKDLLDKMEEMKKEYSTQKKEWIKKKMDDPLANLQNASRDAMDVTKEHFLKDTDPALKLKALHLIEELLFCASWYLSDQFIRAYNGDGEMQLSGFGNPFKDGEGFDYLRDRNKSSQEAINTMTRNQGNRAGSKADFRMMTNAKMKLILNKRWDVPEEILEKLDRRKLMTLIQKKSSHALASGSKKSGVERYARVTGSKKQFSRSQYTRKLKKLMKAHLAMLRGKSMMLTATTGGAGRGGDGTMDLDEDLKDLEADLDDIEMDLDDEDDGGGGADKKGNGTGNGFNLNRNQSKGVTDSGEKPKKKKKTKKVCRKRFKVRYTYSYNDEVTGKRMVEIEEYDEEKHPEILSKYRMCIEEGDTQFTRLNDWSRLYQKRLTNQGEAKVFTDPKQRGRYEEMERIRTMAPEEREKILSKMEREKPHITCSSCKRKGHNSNNKYCPNYHESKERKQEQNRKNAGDQYVDTDGAVVSFIDRAIVQKHKTYRSAKERNKEIQKKRRASSSRDAVKVTDPRLDFVLLLKGILDNALDEVRKQKIGDQLVQIAVFQDDPTGLHLYSNKVKKPMCLKWIDENIVFTEECIKAPYKAATKLTMTTSASAVDASRGRGKPRKTEYKRISELKEDIMLILKNSKAYNGPTSRWTKIAQMMVDAVEAQERKYKGAIESVMEKVKETYMTLELQPILDKIIGGILEAPILSLIKSSDEIREGRLHRANVMGLYEIRQKVHDRNRFTNFGDFVMQLKQLQQCLYDADPEKYKVEISTLAEQFKRKLKRFKENLIHIDPDAADHFELNKKPPFI